MRDVDWERIKEEYENGATLFQLYEKYGITPSLIGWYLKRMGVKMRKRGQRRKMSLESVVEYLTTDITVDDVARKYNITPVTFRRNARELMDAAVREIIRRGLTLRNSPSGNAQIIKRAKMLYER